MRLIGNVIWFILCGLWLGIAWFLLGLLLCITVIGIPLGLQCFKFAKLSFFPYGKKIRIHLLSHPVANVIWAILFGWEMALAYLVLGLLCCVTIVGIPNGIVALKMTKLALFPFGATVD